jgi:trigger factor
LRAIEAIFKVKRHELKEKQLPDLEDEFSKDFSEFDTLEDIRPILRPK